MPSGQRTGGGGNPVRGLPEGRFGAAGGKPLASKACIITRGPVEANQGGTAGKARPCVGDGL
ncbi:translation initiation factor IF-2 [Syntrophothermus lipocalidus DSM 12680]|uniref:Translation initiation factor IF-2 n=1 Tax=Syntrophothermus lipocalidus (strain DSM 12680 / TGB-C1) TaxID=643648 RepID=D7CNV4_SYNLT|nr:translation initiation factor IF-2 [Syntrophothermus lipocalidus DSM 12680]